MVEPQLSSSRREKNIKRKDKPIRPTIPIKLSNVLLPTWWHHSSKLCIGFQWDAQQPIKFVDLQEVSASLQKTEREYLKILFCTLICVPQNSNQSK